MQSPRLAALVLVAGCGASAPPAPLASTAPPPAPVRRDPAIARPVTDDCILEPSAIVGHLQHRAPGVRSIAAPVVTDRTVHEEIELADGTRVSLSLGGCAHYGWELVYVLPAGRIGASAELRLDATAGLLERTPTTDDLAGDLATRIKRRLRTVARAATGPWDIDCGDAVCAVVAERITGGRLRITASYDFPL